MLRLGLTLLQKSVGLPEHTNNRAYWDSLGWRSAVCVPVPLCPNPTETGHNGTGTL